jgi:Golgi phosphoprotein 3 (GPP34)
LPARASSRGAGPGHDGGVEGDLADGVAARLAALCLDGAGRPAPQWLPGHAVRCGVLVDLARAGRLAMTPDSVEIDVRPTGFAAADALLLAMDAEPDRTLDSWLGERRFGLRQVAAALVVSGRWVEHRPLLSRRRYTVVDRERVARDARLDVTAVEASWPAADAAVAALGTLAQLVGEARGLGLQVPLPDVPAAAAAALGDDAWVLDAAMDHLRVARERYRYGATVLS